MIEETVRIIAHEQENARSRKLGEKKTKETYGIYVYLRSDSEIDAYTLLAAIAEIERR